MELLPFRVTVSNKRQGTNKYYHEIKVFELTTHVFKNKSFKLFENFFEIFTFWKFLAIRYLVLHLKMTLLPYFCTWPETNGFLHSNRPGSWDEVNRRRQQRSDSLPSIMAMLVLENSTFLGSHECAWNQQAIVANYAAENSHFHKTNTKYCFRSCLKQNHKSFPYIMIKPNKLCNFSPA